jgi:hypothetical protein
MNDCTRWHRAIMDTSAAPNIHVKRGGDRRCPFLISDENDVAFVAAIFHRLDLNTAQIQGVALSCVGALTSRLSFK